MAFALDAPTVFRVGEPTLGVPLFALEYHGTVTPVATGGFVEDPLHRRLGLLETRLRALELHVEALSRPWYRRVLSWLRACVGHRG